MKQKSAGYNGLIYSELFNAFGTILPSLIPLTGYKVFKKWSMKSYLQSYNESRAST